MLGTWLSTAAWAVNDLPGGPGVRQLNLPVGATKIAEEQAWLHWFMLIICTAQAPQIAGLQACHLPRVGQG